MNLWTGLQTQSSGCLPALGPALVSNYLQESFCELQRRECVKNRRFF